MSEDEAAAQRIHPHSSGPSIDVFISYASQDMAVAEAVCRALEDTGLACWIAPRNVILGEFYAESIVHAIDSAKVLVIVVSQNSALSAHVIREVERASSKRHPVVPFRVDRAPLPAGLEYFLNTSQWLDASGTGVDRALPRLVDGVRNALALHTAAAPIAMGAIAAGRVSQLPSRALLAATLIVGALVYVVIDRGWLSMHVIPLSTTPMRSAAEASAERSVAVLPFVDMSEKKDQQYFAEGLSEEITNQLAKIPELKVAARTSASYESAKNLPISEIGKALGVSTVLEGSVRKSADSVRITAQLVRVRDGYHLWSETYEGRLSDIFKTQDNIAANLVRVLQIRMQASPLPSSGAAEHAEAHDLLLQCRFWSRTGGGGDLEDCTHRAVVLDPGYALAWAWYSIQLDQRDPRAREAAKRAVALSPDLPDAHVALGYVYSGADHDWTRADAEFRRALALDRRNLEALRANGDLAMSLGRFSDAIRFYEQAVDVDSRNSQLLHQLGDAYQAGGRLGEAEGAYRRALALSSGDAPAHNGLGYVALERRDGKAAVAEFKQVSYEPLRLVGLSKAYFQLDRRLESDRALVELTAKYGLSNPYDVANVHAYRRERDAAFDWLAKALKQKDPDVADILADRATTKELASDARFHEILRQLNLSE